MTTTPPAPTGSPQTRPDYFSTFGSGIVPRRGWDAATGGWMEQVKANPVAGLRLWGQTAPARLLSVLSETHPLFKRARSNDLSIAFGPDAVKIVAVDAVATTNAAGQPASKEVVNSTGTAALDALWDGLPAEVGGLRGLQGAIYDDVSRAGATVIEAVPGPRGAGLTGVLTADPLTFEFFDSPTGRTLRQRQGGAPVVMDPERVRYVPWEGGRNNPYGTPRLSASLSEGLRDWKVQGCLDDILYEVAWPRLAWEFPLGETVKFARENPGVLTGQGPNGTDATPEQWAFAQFATMSVQMANRRHDDSIGYIGAIKTLNGAEGLKSLEGTLQALQVRLCTALLQPLTLMNLHLGGTLAYSDTEWRVHATQIEDLRAFVNSVLVWVANRHLRQLGMSCTARADGKPIQTSDRVADAKAHGAEIANQRELYQAGLISDDDVAMSLTGSGVVDKEKLAKWGAAAVPSLPPNAPPEDPAPPEAP